jgi:hypothetical protein
MMCFLAIGSPFPGFLDFSKSRNGQGNDQFRLKAGETLTYCGIQQD